MMFVCQVHVTDVCRAIVHCATPAVPLGVYNLVDKSDTGVTITDMVMFSCDIGCKCQCADGVNAGVIVMCPYL